MDNKLYQTIILDLSDGRTVTAVIPEFCKKGDQFSIIRFQVTEPKELPEDCYWSKIKKENSND